MAKTKVPAIILLLVTLVSTSSAAFVATPPTAIKTSSLADGPLIGNGTFGVVRWGFLGKDVPVVTKIAREEVKNAVSYLETEAHINRRLCLDGSKSRHIAPYLGECLSDEGERRLVWGAAGNLTLQEYVEMPDGLQRLASALGVPPPSEDPHALAKEVLHQILSGLSFMHVLGIVHRDIKPANVLVDEESMTLRLIDFGSACDMANWVKQKGYIPGRGPLSVLFCAPEEFVEEGHPYAFDVYSAGITWLRTMVPGLRDSEDALYDFRVAVRDSRHVLEDWQEAAALSGTLPGGWEGLFGCPEGRHALRLVASMLRYESVDRPSASEALLSPYLNPRCTEKSRPDPPAVAWSLTSHLERWAHKLQTPEECVITAEMYGRVFSVELMFPTGLLMEDGTDRYHHGVHIQGLVEGGSAEQSGLIQPGDALLAIGPIDVEEATLDHVNDILEHWPKSTVSLHFLRD